MDVMRHHNGQALAYVYFEDEPGAETVAFAEQAGTTR
jgi:hypothetical protein